MTEFSPYHDGVTELAGLLDTSRLEDLIALGAYAKLAKRSFVPKDDRPRVDEVFRRHAEALQENGNISQRISWVFTTSIVRDCYDVCDAMMLQDKADATKAQQAQQQQ